MRPLSSERPSFWRAGLALAMTALVTAGVSQGSTSATFTHSATATLQGSTRATCANGTPYATQLATASYLPTVWWRFNMNTGAATVPDLSGHGNNGSVRNTGLTFGTANAGLVTCDATYAMRQPGTATSTGYVVLPTARTSPASFSIATWVLSNSLRGGRVIGFGNAVTGGSATHDRALLFDRAGKAVVHVRTSTGNLLLTSPARVTDNVLHLVVATFDGTRARLYVDGALVATSAAVVPAASYTGYWRAGWDQNIATLIPTSRDQANTRQDEVAIWEGRTLTATEVSTLHLSNHW